jgi:hypothetical protein
MYLLDLIADFFAYGISGFFEWADPYEDRIIKKHIEELKNDPSFNELIDDPKYSQIINHHKGIRGILFREKAVELFLKDEAFRIKFRKAVVENSVKELNRK